MVALKAGEIDGFMRRFGTGEIRSPIILVYGPDMGLVNERARFFAEKCTENPEDPFQLIRLDGDLLASDPARLVDEATTMGLFGGRRTVWVKPSSKNFAPAVDALLAAPSLDGVAVVIEAGDLGRSSPLRALCEKSKHTIAVPCYADSARDLGAVVDDMFREHGFTLSKDVRLAIISSLGGDRMASRGELSKLLLYVHGQSEVTLEDVEAVLADVSSLAMDAIIDAVFSGNPAGFETDFQRIVAEGTPAAVILNIALRHALSLLQGRIDIEAGKSSGAVVESWRGLHFKRKPHIERQLNRWTSTGLKSAIQSLQASLLDTRRMASMSTDIGGRTLLSLSMRRG
ncbi:DNA polymerase III subunit delta [Microvirga sp. W0021]|uniref:DNA-directed DNA polymerase n=1 Tax=Hohaiivirga grylli TaxID=3133970 RepID=A0ABV0BJA3_9HYPH